MSGADSRNQAAGQQADVFAGADPGPDAGERAARPVVPPQVPARGDAGGTSTSSPGSGTGRAGGILPTGSGHGRRRGRRRWVPLTVAGLVVVLAAGAGAVYVAGGFGTRGSSGSGSSGGLSGTATRTVQRETLSERTTVNATLGYAGSYTVTVPSEPSLGSGSPGSGSPGSSGATSPGSSGGTGSRTFTWLPAGGTVIREGQVAYRTNNGVPTYLLYGKVPAWRELKEGMHGADVAELNHDLVRLGYANSSYIAPLGWDYFSWETKYGLEQLQSAIGRKLTGKLPLGQAVFEPRALRVTAVSAHLGASASGPVFSASSARHVVTISLDAAEQSVVKEGDPVSVTLPDGATTPGVISSVGKVATVSGGSGPGGSGPGGSGSGSSATITVQVRLDHPRAAGHLDQAPVTVNITESQAKNVLVVPVAALLARPGGYAVEVVTAAGRHHLVPVRPGLFDGSAGLVQVSGNLSPGQRVVVPAT